jgi:hypothetical protein
VEYYNHLGSLITNDAKYTREIKYRIAMAKATLNKKDLFTSKLDLNLRMKLVMCCIWGIALCGAETGAPRKVDQKYLGISEMWCWRKMEKISWTGRLRSGEVLHVVMAKRNILRAIRKED